MVTTTLDNQVEQLFDTYSIAEDQRSSVNTYLNLLHNKDVPTYDHSVRVGTLGVKVAEFMHLDPKVFLYAGLLHDVGKALVNGDSLKKVEGFNEQDMKELQKHVMYSYLILRDIHDYSAEVALRHHRFQTNGYPKKLPKTKLTICRATKTNINFYARILSLVDFYDAASNRKNNKFGAVRLPSKEEVKELMFKSNKDQEHLINELYEAGIF